MEWFDHSSGAASDDAVIALRMQFPDSAALDCYWTIVEKQYRDERPVAFSETDPETKALCHRLCVGFERVSEYVSAMVSLGLLESDGAAVWSQRAKNTIDAYHAKQETARQNGRKGGRKTKAGTDAKPTRKPTGNRRETTKQNNTGIGLDKLNQYQYASDGAAAAGAAPPSAKDDSRVPSCPLCSGPVRFDAVRGRWECGTCGDVKEPAYREAVA